jgi:hypothetical protein
MSAEPTAPAEEFAPVLYVCKGRRITADNSLCAVLAPIQAAPTVDEDPTADSLYGLTSGTKWLRAGATYLIPTSGTTIKASAAKYQGQWRNTEQTATWQALTDAAETESETTKAHKRDAHGNQELLKQLRPLRSAYSKLIGTGKRLAFELAVLNALRRPVSEKERAR